MKYSILALMGTALSVCGVGAKLKMNIMDTLGTVQPLKAAINMQNIQGSPDGVKVSFIDTVSKEAAVP